MLRHRGRRPEAACRDTGALSELSTVEYTGDSYIIDPRGEIIAGPAEGETILIAEGSMEVVLAAKAPSAISAGTIRGPTCCG